MHAIAISSAFVPAPIVGSRPLRPCNAPPTSTGTAGSQRRTGRSARAARLSVQAFRGVEQKVATVPVTFTMKHKVHFAQEVVLVGNLPQLGGWRLKRAIRMSWSEGNVWSTTVDLPAGAAIEYKFAVQDPDLPPVWETCFNREARIGSSAAHLTGKWNKAFAAHVAAPRLQTRQRQSAMHVAALSKLLGAAGQGQRTGSGVVAAAAAATGAALSAEAALAAQALESLRARTAPAAAAAALAPEAVLTSDLAREAAMAAEVLAQLAPTASKPSMAAKPSPAAGAAAKAAAAGAGKAREPTLPLEAEAAVEEVIAAAEAAAVAQPVARQQKQPARVVGAAKSQAKAAGTKAAASSSSASSKPSAAARSSSPPRPSFRPKLVAPSPAPPKAANAPVEPFFPSAAASSAASSSTVSAAVPKGKGVKGSRGRPSAASRDTPTAAYSPEQLAYLKRSGKL